jgi:virginiamycin B lyase
MMTEAVTLSPPRRRLLTISAAGLVVLSSAGMLLLRWAAPAARFVEYRMPGTRDAPMAIAAAADGTVWFTIDQADAIGRVRGGRIDLLPTPGRNYEPVDWRSPPTEAPGTPTSRPARLCASAPPARWRNLRSTVRSYGWAAWQSAPMAPYGSLTLREAVSRNSKAESSRATRSDRQAAGPMAWQ